MKKELTQELNNLSVECFGKPYEWRKLTRKGLITERQCVNPNGPNQPAFIARRIPLTPQGAKHYMQETLRMRKQIQEEKNNENG